MTGHCLYQNGIASKQNILLSPDWLLIALLLLFVLFGLPSIIGIVFYAASGDWKKGKVIFVPYK